MNWPRSHDESRRYFIGPNARNRPSSDYPRDSCSSPCSDIDCARSPALEGMLAPLPNPILIARQVAVILVIAISGTVSTPGQEQGTAPAALSGALYLDAWQIEKEFLVSPLALQEWIDLGLEPDSEIRPEEKDDLMTTIGNFLAGKCPVTIQDEPLVFTLDRIHFIEPDATEFSIIDHDATVTARDIRISAIYATPNFDPRQALQVFWDLLPDDSPFVTVKVADAGGTRNFNLTKFNPTLNIRGRYRSGARNSPPTPPPLPALAAAEPFRIPWLSLALIIIIFPAGFIVFRAKENLVIRLTLIGLILPAAIVFKGVGIPLRGKTSSISISDAAAARILDPLLRGVYHSFNYQTRDQQYEELDKVAGGEALTPIFLEIQRTLQSRERDGSRVRVNDLRIESSKSSPLPKRPGFQALCEWEVSGRVGHWGHFHDRLNLYRATFVVEPVEQKWKITLLTLHDRQRTPVPPPAPESK